jgi:hypothetical protein
MPAAGMFIPNAIPLLSTRCDINQGVCPCLINKLQVNVGIKAIDTPTIIQSKRHKLFFKEKFCFKYFFKSTTHFDSFFSGDNVGVLASI